MSWLEACSSASKSFFTQFVPTAFANSSKSVTPSDVAFHATMSSSLSTMLSTMLAALSRAPPFLADDGRRYVLDTATTLACSSFTRARKTLTHPSTDLDLLMATLTLNRQASGSLHNGSHFLSVTS